MDEQHPERPRAAGGNAAGEPGVEELPGNRGQDAAAVHGTQRRRRATVRQAPQRREAERNDVAAGSTADVRDEPDPAGVVPGRRLSARFHGTTFMPARER